MNNRKLHNFYIFDYKGFTLIEVLAATLVILLGAGALLALLTQTTSFETEPASQLIASYLAHEGIEIVRNIRDTNFLIIHKSRRGNWTDGLTGCSAGCEADYNDSALTPYTGQFLKIDEGFYTYDAGTSTIFTRKIIVTPQGPDVLDVESQVSWIERGRTHQVKSATKLYNWLNPTQ